MAELFFISFDSLLAWGCQSSSPSYQHLSILSQRRKHISGVGYLADQHESPWLSARKTCVHLLLPYYWSVGYGLCDLQDDMRRIV